MKIALPQQDVVLASKLDLCSILGIKQHSVS